MKPTAMTAAAKITNKPNLMYSSAFFVVPDVTWQPLVENLLTYYL